MLTCPSARDPLAVVERLLAVQGQDPRGFRLAIRSRSIGLAATDVDRALSEDRSLVLTWANRGTLHLLRSEDYSWLHPLIAPMLVTGNAGRLTQVGVSADDTDKAVEVITRSIEADGPLTRAQLGERLEAAGLPTQGQTLIYLLRMASILGHTVRGPMIGREHAYVLVSEWLETQKPVDRERSLAELCRRYLRGHGPADDRDLAKWSGLPLRDVRSGLGSIARELIEHPDGLLALRSPKPEHSADRLPPPRLLGAFDPLLLGWRSREPVLGTHQQLVTMNGIFRAFVLVRGHAAGTWGLSGGVVRLKPFDTLDPTDQAALELDAVDVIRYLAASKVAGIRPGGVDL